MKKMLNLFLILVIALSALAVSAQDATPEAAPEATQMVLGTKDDLVPTDAEVSAAKTALGDAGFVGIIACTLSTEFHSTVANSVKARLDELGIANQIFDSEINVEKQISAIENFTSSGAKVLVVCLFDPPSVLSALEDAAAKGVQIVQYAGRQVGDFGGVTISIEDSDLGKTAGEYAAKLITDEMGGKANVAILDYPDVANVVVRADAIRAALEAGAPDATIVGNYLGGTTENGLASMESALVEHPEINVVVSINDAGAYGAMQALENANISNAIIVGIDAEQQARDLITKGGMYRGTVDTSPAETGTMSANAAVRLLAGADFPHDIAVPTTLITKDNAG